MCSHIVDMSAWRNLLVPEEIIHALREKGFSKPTPIQQRSILPAISKRSDIVGAAETVSEVKITLFANKIIYYLYCIGLWIIL